MDEGSGPCADHSARGSVRLRSRVYTVYAIFTVYAVFTVYAALAVYAEVRR